MTTYALVVVSNGRGQLLEEAVQSVARNVLPAMAPTLICDDSGDAEYGRQLGRRYPFALVDAHRHLGHGPAVARAWQLASDLRADWVLWLEEDMVVARQTDLGALADVASTAGIAQMVLRRNAHFPAEVEAGPTQIDRFDPRTLTDEVTHGHPWLRHRLFYSLNPHLVSTAFLRQHRWPPVPNSEHHFSLKLFRDRAVSVGLWGARDDPPWVHHIGTERTGTGY